MILFLFGFYVAGAVIAFLLTAFSTILGGESIYFLEFILRCVAVAVFYPIILLYFLAKRLLEKE